MLNQSTRSVIDGGPNTQQTINDDGETEITVCVNAISPLAAKLADGVLTVTLCALILYCVVTGLFIRDTSMAQRVVTMLAPVPTYFMLKWALYSVFTQSKSVAFTPDTITLIKFGIRRFDRSLGVKFALYEHPKAGIEKKRIELREAKRTVRWYSRALKPYYQTAHVLVLEYMGQPNIVGSIYSYPKAKEIVARLSAVNEIIGRYGDTNHGTPVTPDQDWSDVAGGLPGSQSGGLS